MLAPADRTAGALPIRAALKAAVGAAEKRGQHLNAQRGVLGRAVPGGDGEKLLQAAGDDAGILAHLERDLQHPGEAVLLPLGLDDVENAAGQTQLMHQRSRQLKQGSMLAMMRPASATVLPRSMNGMVGVFLKLGTWMLTRWLFRLPLPTTMWLS